MRAAVIPLPESAKPYSHKAFPFRDGTSMRSFYKSPYRFATACGLALQGLGLVPFDVDLLPEKKQSFFARIKNRFSKKRPVAAWGMDVGNSCMKAVKIVLDADGVPVIEHCFHCHYHFDSASKRTKKSETDISETKIMDVLDEPSGSPFMRDEHSVAPQELDFSSKRKLAVKAFLHQYEYQGEIICVGYPAQDLICANVAIPANTPEIAEAAIPFEFKHHLPYDEDRFIPNYMCLGAMDDEGVTKQCFYLFSAKISTMRESLDLLDEFGIAPDMMTTNVLANLNYATFFLMHPPSTLTPEETFEPPEVESILSCDMGSLGTDLVFYSMKEILHYYIPIGGDHFTKEIATVLNIPLVRAEGFKRNPLQSGHDKEIVEALKPVVRRLVQEITLRMERFRKSGGKLDKVVVMGSGFQLQGFEAYFRNVLKNLWK